MLFISTPLLVADIDLPAKVRSREPRDRPRQALALCSDKKEICPGCPGGRWHHTGPKPHPLSENVPTCLQQRAQLPLTSAGLMLQMGGQQLAPHLPKCGGERGGKRRERKRSH